MPPAAKGLPPFGIPFCFALIDANIQGGKRSKQRFPPYFFCK